MHVLRVVEKKIRHEGFDPLKLKSMEDKDISAITQIFLSKLEESLAAEKMAERRRKKVKVLWHLVLGRF